MNASAVDIVWKIVDVGGQQSERRKWMSQFSNVDSSIFVINLCGYQNVMFENPDKLRMHDSLNVLKSIYGTPTGDLNSKPLTVIFNKVDMYHETFDSKNFLKCFHNYPKEDLGSKLLSLLNLKLCIYVVLANICVLVTVFFNK